VEFCKDAGIIDGYEDGTFHPYRNLTTDQWLKMLLTAIGFDAAEFGLTGKDWAINTAEVALRYDLITADEYALDFDREVAILYAYNALTFSFKTEKPLSEKVFGLTTSITYDIFAAPTAEVFSSKGKEIASFAIAPATTKEIVNAASDKVVIPAGYDVYVDGVSKGNSGYTADKNSYTVYLYDANAYTTAGTPNATKTAIVLSTQVRILDDQGTNALTLNTLDPIYKAETGKNLVVGDVVTFNVGNSKYTGGADKTVQKNVTVLNATAGTVTARNVKNNWINVDESANLYFNANAKPTTAAAANKLKTAEKYNFYYDSYGNVAAVLDYVPAQPEQTLVFLIAAYAKTSYTYNDVEQETVEESKAKYIDLTTGEIKTMTFDTLDSKDVATLTGGNFQGYYFSGKINSYYTATTDAEGNVALTEYTTFNYANVTNAKASVQIGASKDSNYVYTADSKTQLSVLTYTGDLEVESVDVQTGIQNFKTATYDYDGTYVAVVKDKPSDTVPSNIYVITPKAEPTETYVYAMYMGENTDYQKDGQGYDFLTSDGTTTTLYFDEKGDFANTNPSDGVTAPALVKNAVYKLTIQNGSFTKYEKLTAITGKLVYTDVSYVSIINLESVYYYANDFGGLTFSTTGADMTGKVVVDGTLDVNGRVQAGSTVNLYTDDDSVTGKIVFMTVQ
jgi:hypothetical protein